MRITDIILKKRSGEKLTREEITFVADGAADGSIPDYQLSAWLMAVFFNGLTKEETAWLTKAMADSGDRLDLRAVKGKKVDKHSTGGVGDGVSLALAPIVGACGVPVPMMSGRGLGHTGGTLDKLEAIPGFNVRLPVPHILKQLKAINVAMFGQTGKLAPSDKKLYSLRDATCTVESLPLIVASILSKKYTEDIQGLVMDVKYGSGAFLKTFEKSRELAVALKNTAELLGMRCVAILTAMEEPLGLAVGNGIEMRQSIDILKGKGGPADFMEVLLEMAGWMIHFGGKAKTPAEGRLKAMNAIEDGSALETLRKMIKMQGGDPRVIDAPEKHMPNAKHSALIKAPGSGYLNRLDARTIGRASVVLGAGRTKAEDGVDFGAGFILAKKTGDKVAKGEVIATAYASDKAKLAEGVKMYLSAVGVGASRPRPSGKLIKEIIK